MGQICILVVSPEIKVPLGSFSCRWVNNIKMGLRERRGTGVDWNEVARRKREAILITVRGIPD
jgi:hypothetical protein